MSKYLRRENRNLRDRIFKYLNLAAHWCEGNEVELELCEGKKSKGTRKKN